MIYLADLWSHKAKWRFWDHQLYLSSFSIIFFWSSVHCTLRWQGQHHNNVKSSKHFQGAKLKWHGGSFRAYKKWKLLMFVVLQTLSELLTDYESVLSDCVSAGTYREELWLPGKSFPIFSYSTNSFPQNEITILSAGISVEDKNFSFTQSWDFIQSVFFTTTILTTIGYGHIAPVTTPGNSLRILGELRADWLSFRPNLLHDLRHHWDPPHPLSLGWHRSDPRNHHQQDDGAV